MPERETRVLTEPEEPPPGGRRAETVETVDPRTGEPRKPSFGQRLRGFPRRHPVGWVVLLILLAALIIGGYFLLHYFSSYESTDDAQVSGHLNPVASRIDGTVTGVYVENNQTVNQGQLIVDLDPRDFQVALQQAQANLAQAQGQLAGATPNVPITQAENITAITNAQQAVTSADAALAAAHHDYQASVADLKQAQANNDVAQSDAKRYAQLVAKDEVSREQYDQKRATADAAAAQVDARRSAMEAADRMVTERQAALAQAQNQLRLAQQTNPQQLQVRRADIQARRGSVQQAQAALANAQLQLSYTRITAPVSGVVGNKHVEVGTRVQPGQELMNITEVGNTWVDANFKETQIVNMHPGQRASIHVDALAKDFTGSVQNLPGATGAQYSLLPPENATGNFVKVVQRLPVRILLDPNQPELDRLRPGMSVEAKVWLR